MGTPKVFLIQAEVPHCRHELKFLKRREPARAHFIAEVFSTKEKNMANEQRGGSGNFANDPQRASEAGKKGGEQSHSGQQQQGGGSGGQQGGGNPGNFANDKEKASEAGRKGGQR